MARGGVNVRVTGRVGLGMLFNQITGNAYHRRLGFYIDKNWTHIES